MSAGIRSGIENLDNGGGFRLGLIGYGEVGSSFASGLKDDGLVDVLAYDSAWQFGDFAELIQSRAGDAGVRLTDSLRELVDGCDILIGVVPGSQCVRLARSLKPLLRDGQIYADFASTTPGLKRKVFAVLGEVESFVDGAIMSHVLTNRNHSRVLLSGPSAEAFEHAIAEWGFDLEVVGTEPGIASGIKSLRSVVTKGLEALVFECMVASDRYGLADQVSRSLIELMDSRESFDDAINFHLTSGAVHSARRAEEAEMSATTLRGVGINPIMTDATAERLHWVEGLGLSHILGGITPNDYRDVLRLVRKRLAPKLLE